MNSRLYKFTKLSSRR